MRELSNKGMSSRHIVSWDRVYVRVLFCERITALLALAQVSPHCSPGVRVRKVYHQAH